MKYIALVLSLAALPALADYSFFGYGLQLESSPLLSGGGEGTALNDRVLYIGQGEPLGVVVDAQFFGLSGLSYAITCGLEGASCPSADALFRGGGYSRLAAVDAQLSLDLEGWHVGLGLASDLTTRTLANKEAFVAGLGGELSVAKSRLGPLYLQADLGVLPTFDLDGLTLVGVRPRAELTAVVAIPWVALFASAGYQVFVPLDGATLEHGPYVSAGVMFSVSTLMSALGLVGDVAGGAASGVKNIVGGEK